MEDMETGYYSFELRDYDSKIGRWTTIDPYRQYYSPYLGMGNNPTHNVAPDGGCATGDTPCIQAAKAAGFTSQADINAFVNLDAYAPSPSFGDLARAWAGGINRSVTDNTQFIRDRTQKWSDAVTQGNINQPNNAAQQIIIPTAQSIYDLGLVGSGMASGLPLTAATRVGSYLDGVEDIMANPSLLQGRTVAEISEVMVGSSRWVRDVMRRSSRATGVVFREVNDAGTDFTGRIIQYHPGTPRHFGGKAYWKVSNGQTGTTRIPLD